MNERVAAKIDTGADGARAMSGTPSHIDRVLQATVTLRDLLTEYRPLILSAEARQEPSAEAFLSAAIFRELEEICSICGLLYSEILPYLDFAQRMAEIVRSGRHVQHIPDTMPIMIHIKALYEWLYHVQDIIDQASKEKPPVDIKSLVKDETWNRLYGFSGFRDKLIVHKTGVRGFLISGLRSGHDTMELMLAIFGMPQAAIDEMNAIFPQYSKYLTPEEQAETNIYERSSILNRNLHLIPSRVERRPVLDFIAKYGTHSASPAELAEFSLTLAQELFPALVRLVDSVGTCKDGA